MPISSYNGVPWGGAVALIPAYDSENTRGTEFIQSTSKEITLAYDVPVGKRVVIVYSLQSNETNNVVGCSDNAVIPNTYSSMVSQTQYNDSNRYTTIYSAHVASALSAGSKITVSNSANVYHYRTWAVFVLNGCASTGQPDQTASASTYGSSISASAAPASSPTILVGVVKAFNTKTYTPGSGWTQIGTAHDNGDIDRYWYVYKAVTGTSAQNIGGTLSAADVYYAMWAGFK